MGYWHLADLDRVCTGSIAERARTLREIVLTSGSNVQKWPLTPQQIRAMTLELAVASAQRGEPCGSDLLHLLAWATNVPESFLYDPTEVLSGRDGKGQGVDPSVRQGAELLDYMHFQKTGKYMTVYALAKATNASRQSVREWVKGWRTQSEAASETTVPFGYETENWAKLSPRFRAAYNQLRMARGKPPIPEPEVDLYVPPQGV